MSEPPVQHTQFQYDRDDAWKSGTSRARAAHRKSPVAVVHRPKSEKADAPKGDRDTWRPSTDTAGVTPGSPGGPPAPATKQASGHRHRSFQLRVRNFELGIGYWTEKLLITKKSWNYEIDTSCGIYALMTRKSRSLPASNSYKLGKLFWIDNYFGSTTLYLYLGTTWYHARNRVQKP